MKIDKKEGFSLITLCFYSGVNALLLILVLSVIKTLYKTQRFYKTTQNYILQTSIVAQHLINDITQASVDQQKWCGKQCVFTHERCTSQGIIEIIAIGWEVDLVHHGLKRIKGSFDFSQERWLHKKKTDFFPCPITMLTMQPPTNYTNPTATLSFTEEQKNHLLSVPLKNGYIRL